MQRSEGEERISHVHECQDVEKNAQLCHYFVYFTNGEKISAGKSSPEKSTITQCSLGLWSKLYRCRFQSERPIRKKIL